MKNWQKIVVAVVGSGILGGLGYSSALYPNLTGLFIAVGAIVAGTMTKLIGWTPVK